MTGKSYSRVSVDAEQNPESLVEGVDPRTGDLTRHFLGIHRQEPQTSALAIVSLDELSDLVESEDDADTKRLLDYLRDLRNLLDDHVRVDVVNIIGDP